MDSAIKKSPSKPVYEEEEDEEDTLEDPEDETQSYDDDDLEEVDADEPVVPTNKPQPKNNEKAQVELQLELKIRRLCEVETQLITKKIALKNSDSLAGVYTEQEMISLCQTLKFEIQTIIDFMKANFKYDNKFFVEKFKEVEKGIKGYEYWVVSESRKTN